VGVKEGVWLWGVRGEERDQVKRSPDEWPVRRVVWSAEIASAVTEPDWTARRAKKSELKGGTLGVQPDDMF
jgi:hypothetical protein